MLSNARQNILLVVLIVCIVIITGKALLIHGRYDNEIGALEKQIKALAASTKVESEEYSKKIESVIKLLNKQCKEEVAEALETLENLPARLRVDNENAIEKLKEHLKETQAGNDKAFRELKKQLEVVQAADGKGLQELKKKLQEREAQAIADIKALEERLTIMEDNVSDHLLDFEHRLNEHWHMSKKKNVVFDSLGKD